MGSRNGYGYVEGNPVNRTDPSGECWKKSDSQPERAVCLQAWHTLTNNQPDWETDPTWKAAWAYWSSLSYTEFIKNWNDPSIGLTGGLQSSANATGLLAGTLPITQLDGPIPGPADLFWLGVCIITLIAVDVTERAIPVAQRSNIDWDKALAEAIRNVDNQGKKPTLKPGPRIPPSTPEPDEVVRHYTSRHGYRQIKQSGWLMRTSDVGFGINIRQGLFFTGTDPILGGYERRRIGAFLGIDLERTACYIDVSKGRLKSTGQGHWEERLFWNSNRPEHIFITQLPLVNVSNALVTSGSTADLGPQMNETLVEKCE